VLDVRSPAEYNHAHIPGAYCLPLFSDEERKIVGTQYKQQSKQQAIKTGLNYFGTKMVTMVEEVEKITDERKKSTEENTANHQLVTVSIKTVLVHCWRGGMRSAGVAWLLDLYGFKVYTLAGGYKAFRRWVLQKFEKNYSFKILGGYTGSGKTAILKMLEKKGKKVIDLEELANHKGSAFGNLGTFEQPGQEMFENKLAIMLSTVNSQPDEDFSSLPYGADGKRDIWIEDESQRIGDVNIPINLYRYIQTRPVYFIDISFEERLHYLVQEYGKFDKEKLVNAILRIKKRLGGLETKAAISYLIEDDITNCFRILLKYYDKGYLKSLQQKEHLVQFIKKIPCEKVNAERNANIVMQAHTEIYADDK
jgi:tRNA 2-selenouridine synthase